MNHNQQIQVEDLTLIEKLGSGSYGEVYLTKKEKLSGFYATKKVANSVALNEKNKKYFNNELYILRNFSHESIIKLFEIKRTANNFYLVFEYCNGGTLNSCLKAYMNKYSRPFTESESQHIIKQVTKGLHYLHSVNIVHRDLKMDNIMLHFKNEEDKNKINLLNAQVKIIDFGFAKILENNDMADSILGSPLNMDPVMLGGIINKVQVVSYDEKADLWSLGTICYNMMVGYPPFQATNYKDLHELTLKGQYKIPLTLKLSKQALSFIVSLLQNDPKQREHVNNLVLHEFIQYENFEPIPLVSIPNELVFKNDLILSTLSSNYHFLSITDGISVINPITESDNFKDSNFNQLFTFSRFDEKTDNLIQSFDKKELEVKKEIAEMNSYISRFSLPPEDHSSMLLINFKIYRVSNAKAKARSCSKF